LDDNDGRSEVAAVLALWPGDHTGRWGADPRTNLVRFFLNGRESSVKAGILARTLDSLSAVPAETTARIKLLTGDVEEAERLARDSQDSELLGWTPFFIDLARLRLKEGRAEEARRALDRLAPGAQSECNSLLIRREIARAAQDDEEVAVVGRSLEDLLLSEAFSEPAPDEEARISLCIDPESSAGRALRVHVESADATVLVYAWNGGRAGRFAVSPGSTFVELAIDGRSGDQELSIGSLEEKSGGVSRVTASLVGRSS